MAKKERKISESEVSATKAKKAATPRKEPPNVDKITVNFLAEIRSIKFAQEETAKVLKESADKHRQAFQKFLASLNPKKEGTALKFMIPVERAEELKRLLHELSSATGSLPLSRRGLFLVLVSKWDAYFGSMLRWIYRIRPEIIDGSSRTITFTELKQINSIDMARNKIVEDEIGVVLRDSHGEQFEYLERKLSIPLRKVDIWPNFIELTQRRNLIAHADGKVSDQYLKVCRDHKVPLEADVSIGSDLGISSDYLRKSCDCLAELGVKLSQVVWRKLQPAEAAKATSHFLDTTYEMVKASQYELAIKLLTFSLAPPMKLEGTRDRYICVVNLALAHKWMNDEKRCAEIVEAEDWTAASLDFRLAVAVLRDNFDEAVSLMKQIGVSGEVTKENYEEWPLFNKFRRTEGFLETYRDTFKTNLEVRTVPSEVASALSVPRDSKRASKRKSGAKANKALQE